MMYSKLAFRNIRRSLRDYIIYFVTLTLTAALMYSFLALGFSPDILAMTENMSMLTSGILMLSVLVALLSSFVVGYAIRFMLGQRKKEFAAYELMGMEVKTVRNLFLVENSIIGGAAFLLGSLLGTAMSGLLNQVVQNIFEIPHRYQVLFSLRALGMTLFFFILMYGFGMLRAAKVIRRRKVIDLLYDNQKNEEAGFQPLHRSVLTCLLSLAAMVAGVILLEKGLHIQTNEAMLYWGGACLLILAGVYELHRKIPMLLYQLAKRNPHRKYREETLFFLGQIGRRIQSSGRTMAVVAILLTVSLATMFVGMTMGAGYKANMEAYYPYDAGVAIDAPLTKDSIGSRLACTGAAYDQHVQGAAVLVGIQPQADVFGQQLVLFLSEHGIDLTGRGPCGGAVFLAVPGPTLLVGVETDTHDVRPGAGQDDVVVHHPVLLSIGPLGVQHLAALPARVAVQMGSEDALLGLVPVEDVVDAHVQAALPGQDLRDSHRSPRK